MSKTALECVKLARSNDRPTGKEYLDGLLSPFVELHGDRRVGDDPAVIGGVGLLEGMPVTALATEKGRKPRERALRNCGAPSPEGYRKALRLMKQAEKFHRPVVCFVDTAGAFCGLEAEERGQGQAIAENLWTLAGLETPVLSVLIGEGGSGGALALAAGDQVWMLEHAVYSVISPEGCASILWRDPKKVGEAAQCLKLTARDALELRVADRIFPERSLGSKAFFTALSRELSKTLRELAALPVPELLRRRQERFLQFGGENRQSAGIIRLQERMI